MISKLEGPEELENSFQNTKHPLLRAVNAIPMLTYSYYLED
jgi:hypothetical protein